MYVRQDMFWYLDEIKRLETKIKSMEIKNPLVFFGSSTFTLWDKLEEEFADLEAINLGFGGSTLAGCIWYIDRVFVNIAPKGVVLYAGENDLGDRRHPEEILIFYREFRRLLRLKYPEIPFVYISLKPSPSKMWMQSSVEFTNKLISAAVEQSCDNDYFIDIYNELLDESKNPYCHCFENDGLHLSEAGYDVIKEIIKNNLREIPQIGLEKALPEMV